MPVLSRARVRANTSSEVTSSYFPVDVYAKVVSTAAANAPAHDPLQSDEESLHVVYESWKAVSDRIPAGESCT